MAGIGFHHPHSSSSGSSTSTTENWNAHVSARHSDAGSSHHTSVSWPEERNGSGGASIHGGFDPGNLSARLTALAARYVARTARTGASRAPSIASSDHSSDHSSAHIRSLHGGETRPELIEIIAQMQDHIGVLSRALHDAGASHDTPATREEKKLAHQKRLLKAQSKLEERRFEHEMKQLDREEARMQRREEHENYKAAHELQMKALEEAQMEAKIQQKQEEIRMNKVMESLNLLVNASQQSMQLTRQL